LKRDTLSIVNAQKCIFDQTLFIVNVLEIYTESTPNPTKLKFVTSKQLLPQMIFEGKGVDECADSPFALALFEGFPEIGEVFISNNFVTLTKVDDTKDWFEVIYTIKAFMHTYITEGNVIVSDRFMEAYKESMKSQSTGGADIEQKIIHLLETYVRPAVETDGGNIAFEQFDQGIVTVKLQGACSGCPSSTATLKDGIEAMLKRMLPEVKEVVALAE
jgi:Fe-S cluster biogenesis protein NfuA